MQQEADQESPRADVTLKNRMRESAAIVRRVAGLVALAALAAGASYKVARRVTTHAAQSREVTPATSAPHRLAGLSAVGLPDSLADGLAAPQLAASMVRPDVGPAPSLEPEVVASTAANEEHAVHSARSEPAPTPVRPPPTAAVASVARAPKAQEKGRAREHTEAAQSVQDVRVAAPDRAAAAAVPSRPAAPGPAVPMAVREPEPMAPRQAALDLAQLTAATSIARLDVRGSLTATSVRRSVERVRPALASCYGQAARQRPTAELVSGELRFTIDETGHARSVTTTHAAVPALDECLRSAIGRLVSRAPDTGRVQTVLQLRFEP